MVDEFAEHQEVGEMELAAADGHRTAGLGLHQAALKILDAGDDVSRPVAKRRNVGMILTGVDERADVRDERADVVRDLVAANAVAVGHVVAGKLGEVLQRAAHLAGVGAGAQIEVAGIEVGLGGRGLGGGHAVVNAAGLYGVLEDVGGARLDLRKLALTVGREVLMNAREHPERFGEALLHVLREKLAHVGGVVDGSAFVGERHVVLAGLEVGAHEEEDRAEAEDDGGGLTAPEDEHGDDGGELAESAVRNQPEITVSTPEMR